MYLQSVAIKNGTATIIKRFFFDFRSDVICYISCGYIGRLTRGEL